MQAAEPLAAAKAPAKGPGKARAALARKGKDAGEPEQDPPRRL